MPGFVIWGRLVAGGAWEQYHPPHADSDEAEAECHQLRVARPDRQYVIQLEGAGEPKEPAQ